MAIAIVGTDGNPITSRDIDASPNNFIFVAGRFVFSGNYTNGTGDTLDWTTIIGVPIPSQVCIQVFADTALGTINFYAPVGGPATALNGWKVRVYTGITELSTAAYTAAITADTIIFQALFRKLL